MKKKNVYVYEPSVEISNSIAHFGIEFIINI